MKKVALLIGVGEYVSDLPLLPSTTKDIEAMQRVLADPLMGEFNEVKPLINPDRQQMESEIEALFSAREKSDLVLLYFSGHGIKDDRGDLYFATRQTRKTPKGELIKSTAVSADFVHKIMSDSRSKRQVVILDCCFSGAFAEGMTAKDGGVVDIQMQLGGEGRAVLTSSTSTQYSFDQETSGLSVYTRYIVQGIETGAADLDSDGIVAVDELHDYAKVKVQEMAPAMKPEIYAVKEGFRIYLAHASPSDPQLHYRRDVQRFANRGEISEIARTALEALRRNLNLTTETAALIEDEVLEPSREHHKNLRQYEQTFFEAVWREYPLCESTVNDLKYLQHILGLRDEDIRPIEARVLSRKASMQNGAAGAIPSPARPSASALATNHNAPVATLTRNASATNDSGSLPPKELSRQRESTSSMAESHRTNHLSQGRKRFSAWTIALWVVVVSSLSAGGGYAYWRWQQDQELRELTQASEEILEQATQQFETGDIDGAIAHLNTIATESHLYSEAQDRAATWRTNWDADAVKFNDLKSRLDSADDLQGAELLASQMQTPHWQEQAEQAIAEARARVDSNTQNRLQAAEIARQRAEEEAAAERRAAQEAARQQALAEQRARENQALLNNPPVAGDAYRAIIEDVLNVRSPGNGQSIGEPIGAVREGTLVRVTGQQMLARLPAQDNQQIVWAEIDEPIQGWVSRRMIEGPVSSSSLDE